MKHANIRNVLFRMSTFLESAVYAVAVHPEEVSQFIAQSEVFHKPLDKLSLVIVMMRSSEWKILAAASVIIPHRNVAKRGDVEQNGIMFTDGSVCALMSKDGYQKVCLQTH